MKPATLGGLALLAVAGAAYCFSGYVMAGSFSVAGGTVERYRGIAAWWGFAGLVSLALAFALIIAAWKQLRASR
jgi:hypothetical protein